MGPFQLYTGYSSVTAEPDNHLDHSLISMDFYPNNCYLQQHDVLHLVVLGKLLLDDGPIVSL